MPVLFKSFVVFRRFVRGLPGIVFVPFISQCTSCLGSLSSSIHRTCPSHLSFRSFMMMSVFSTCVCALRVDRCRILSLLNLSHYSSLELVMQSISKEKYKTAQSPHHLFPPFLPSLVLLPSVLLPSRGTAPLSKPRDGKRCKLHSGSGKSPATKQFVAHSTPKVRFFFRLFLRLKKTTLQTTDR